MFNTIEGTKSFCKIPIKYKEKLNNLDLDENILNELYKKGILVENDLNENQKLYSLHLDIQKPSNLFLIINPTEQCNFRCVYCYETFKNGTMTGKIQEDIIKFVRENIHNYTGLNVSWFGGEPLLAMECISNLSKNFIEICKFNKKPYTSSITTNGYLLDIETFKELLSYKVSGYQITIDGTKSLHNKQRTTINGKPTYERIVKNLNDIFKLKRKNFRIKIRANITNEIFKNLNEYIKNISIFSSSDDRCSVSFYKVGNWLDKVKIELRSKLIKTTETFKDIYEAFINSNALINLNTSMLNPGGGVCYGGKKNNYFLTSDGALHKCTVNFENKNSIIGEINNGSLKLNHRFYSMLSSFKNCPKYEECFYAPICMGDPCPLKRRNVCNCPYYKEHLDKILILVDKNKPFPMIVEK